MNIICVTGEIGSGKTTFTEILREHEPQSIGLESSQIIMEVANELLRRLPTNDLHTVGYVAVNTALANLKRNIIDPRWPDVVDKEILFIDEDIRSNPDHFEKLNLFIDATKADTTLLNTTITAENKQEFRPLLQWLGGYAVHKLSESFWFDEITRRIEEAEPQPKLVTVGALRYPADERTMREFAQGLDYTCVVVEVDRPGITHQNDVTENQRSAIKPDVVIHNNATLRDLSQSAKSLLRGVINGSISSSH